MHLNRVFQTTLRNNLSLRFISSKTRIMPTFKEAPASIEFVKEEEKILQFWKEIDAFKTSYEKSKGKPIFTFYDGPPFATGLPHYGHILAGTIKDCVTRFAHQTGHCVERRFGWDTHGLPVENQIDKEFNIKSREDVLAMGIDKYNEECRKIVMRYSAEWRTTVERMGRWIDFDNDYKTLDKSFMESVWWAFSEMYKKGLVYRAFKVMPYSTACNTPLSNFELSLNYQDVTDPSVVVSFPIRGQENVRLLAWTTTPWTLPSNLALCVKDDFEYVKFKIEGPAEIQNAPANAEATYILAAERVEWFIQELKNGFHGKKEEKALIKATILEKVMGKELIGTRYVPLFNYFNKEGTFTHDNAFRIVSDNYVTSGTGTGIVHQAPAFGEDDYRVCVSNQIIKISSSGDGLPCPVDHNGNYTDEVPEHKGVNVKEADNDIKIRIRAMGRLVTNESLKHSYPFCWRSNTPLIYRAIPAWFINVETIKERLVQNNKQTTWVPSFVGEGRFHNWLEGATDWCVSRNRYWGTPIPIWASEDFSELKVMGSVAELESYTGKKYTDIHRHFIDQDVIISPETGKTLRRVDEVLDCWFESGAMPYGQLHYPFENKDKFENGFPADFIGEGLDQTRGWFYTLMVIGTALFDKPPFKNVIVNGLVLAADGKKMSKSLRNYPDPHELINEMGADAIRLYLINSPVVHADPLRFQKEGVRTVIRDAFLPLYNSYRFLLQEVSRFETTYNLAHWQPNYDLAHSSTNPTDKWIVACTHNLISFFHQEMKAYRLYTVVPSLLSYLDNLTNWYIRFNRDRMRGAEGQEEALRSLSTLYEVILTLARLLAPFTPFLSELLYQNLKLALPDSEREDSVHYTSMPIANISLIDPKAEELFNNMKRVIEVGRALREQQKVGLKTPVAKITIMHPEEEFLSSVKALESYVTEQLNVVGDVVYSSDANSLGFTALPNSMKLGKALGKQFAAVTKGVRALDSATLSAFTKELKTNPNATLTVEGVPLGGDDIIIRLEAHASLSEDAKKLGRLVHTHTDQTVVIAIDFTPDAELINMATTREVANQVQKLRKSAGLVPEDDIHIVLLPEFNAENILESLATQQQYAAKLLRRPVHVAPQAIAETAPGSDGSFGSLHCSENIEIGENSKVLVKIYKKN